MASRTLTLAPNLAELPAQARPARTALASTPRAGLTLAIDRRGVGFALDAPLPCPPLRITELESTIVGLRFPVDVSGGLARFRHRRSLLHTLELDAEWSALERTIASACRGIVGMATPSVHLGAASTGEADGLRLTLRGEETLLHTTPQAVLAFEIAIQADSEDLVLYVHSARSIGTQLPASTLAIRALAQVLGALGKRSGSAFRIASIARSAAIAAFPAAGVRAPDAFGMRCVRISRDHERLTLRLQRGSDALAPSHMTVRAAETAHLAQAADDGAFAGEFVLARAAALAGLERAPTHPGLLRRLAEFDAHLGEERSEVARSWLRELDARELVGGLAGALAQQTQDHAAAIAEFLRTAGLDPDPAIAAGAWQAAAELATDEATRIEWLGRALALRPDLRSARLARLEAALRCGMTDAALLDLSHLEAASEREQLHVLRLRVGNRLLAAGAEEAARRVYERALRVVPSDPPAMLGLGRCLARAGAIARAATVFRGAAERAAELNLPSDEPELELARLLAHDLQDVGAALARLRRIGDDTRSAVGARVLEAELRVRLNDLAGMRMAHARLRALTVRDESAETAACLLQAAQVEWSLSGDAQLARAHLEVALSFLGHHAGAEAFARELGAVRQTLRGASDLAAPATPTPALAHAAALAPSARDAAPADGADTATLRRRVEADPSNFAHVLALATRLQHDAEWMELLSIALARIDEGGDDASGSLHAFKRVALAALAADPVRALGERELYASMLAADESA